MRNSVLMLFVLGLLLMAIVAPFSGLAMLMIVVFVAALIWAASTLVSSVFSSSDRR